MKVLMTGSGGYIGKATMQALLKDGHTVVPFDLPSWDILDRRQLLTVFQRNRFDAVLHLAALSSIPEAEDKPGTAWATNVQGTVNVLDAMVVGGCPNLVFASTLAAGCGYRPGLPCTVYGWTKLAAEQIIKTHAEASNLTAFALRYSNVAGGKHTSQTHLVPNLIRASRNKQPLTVTAPLETVRDFVHLEDVARANQFFLEAQCGWVDHPRFPAEGFHCMDIASGVGFQLRDVIKVGNTVLYRNGMNLVEWKVGPHRMEPPNLVASIREAYEWGWEAKLDLGKVFESAIKSD